MISRSVMRLLFISYMLMLASYAGAQAPDITGDWDLTILSPEGTHKAKAQFKQTGEKLAGSIKGDTDAVTLEGTVTGTQIKFLFVVKYEGSDLPITLAGAVDGKAIKGTADFGGMAQGEWSAERSPAAQSQPAASPDAAVDVTGVWNVQIEIGGNTGTPTFTFKQEGEKLTGQYKGMLGEAQLQGTIKGGSITFSFNVSPQGQDVTVTYSGTVEKDTMKGTAKFGSYGEGSFTGKRQ